MDEKRELFYRDQMRQIKLFCFYWIHQENMSGKKYTKCEAFKMWCERGYAEKYRQHHL